MIGIKSHELWKLFRKAAEREDPESASELEVALQDVCKLGSEMAITIRDNFPTYTLHDEKHICNVMSNMLNLLGEAKSCLTRNECALLILAACYHDIGMSVDKEELEYLKQCPNCIVEYLETHPVDFNIVYPNSVYDVPNVTSDVIQRYVRATHHIRVRDQLRNTDWPAVLGKCISVDELIAVCQSHGEHITKIKQYKILSPDLDLYLCAVLLRLGDILDFDMSRAPESLLKYMDLDRSDKDEDKKSLLEWYKHQASLGFVFSSDSQHTLLYRAECKSIQVEHSIMLYLDWVDQELLDCGELIRYMDMRWRSLLLPNRVVRQITARGYISGKYKITLAKEQVLELLSGQNIYDTPFVFVRELLQNAIDAVRTRKQLDNRLPRTWRPQINIRTWTDPDGFYWFKIEDNGIGMTEYMIREFFLKVGNSYYNSEQFKFDKVRFQANIDYMPISRFGIGLLSCFMGDLKDTRIEVSTKHFAESGCRYPAYRMSIHGISDYYYIASDMEQRTVAEDLPDCCDLHQKFIQEPGTIIAVRTNPYLEGDFRGFKQIVDRYVLYPEVAIHYEGPDGTCDYPTEYDFIDEVHKIMPKPTDDVYRAIEQLPLPDKEFGFLKQTFPDITWKNRPHFELYCLPFDYFTDSPLISGAAILVKVLGTGLWNSANMTIKHVPTVSVDLLFCHDGRYAVPSNEIKLEVTINLPTNLKKELEDRILSELKIHNLVKNIHKIEKGVIYKLKEKKLRYVTEEELHIYELLQKTYSYTFLLKEFKFFPWINKWFSSTQIPETNLPHCLNIHNGIHADTTVFFTFSKCAAEHAILLLKDKYRPELGLSRNRMKGYTLEARCRVESLWEEIANHLQVLYRRSLERQEDMLIPLRAYVDMFQNDPNLLSVMRFKTGSGIRSLHELECMLLSEKFELMFTKYCSQIELAVLAWKFSLSIDSFCWKKDLVKISKKKPELSDDRFLDFPPALFLPTDDNKLVSLGGFDGTTTPINAVYNIGHPFSKWLLKNREILEKKVPVLYRNIIAALRHTDTGGFSNTIDRINSILSTLRHHPFLRIEITPDLTPEDFTIECIVEDHGI